MHHLDIYHFRMQNMQKNMQNMQSNMQKQMQNMQNHTMSEPVDSHSQNHHDDTELTVTYNLQVHILHIFKSELHIYALRVRAPGRGPGPGPHSSC
jgi:hypothetical protein